MESKLVPGCLLPEVVSSTNIVGRNTFWVDPTDDIAQGFMLIVKHMSLKKLVGEASLNNLLLWCISCFITIKNECCKR